MTDRFLRHMPLFGESGQQRIRQTRVALVGAGGLGSHVLQQLAFLGVRQLAVIEPDELDDTNRNRLVGAQCHDPAGMDKLAIAERLVRSIDGNPVIEPVHSSLISIEAYEAVKSADVTFGCVDKDGPRLILNELCSAYEIPYIDLASDVLPGEPPEWGGRVVSNWDGGGCVVCLDEINAEQAGRQIAGPEDANARREIYGIEIDALAGGGPSVVSVNGVVASLAVTEFMAGVTRLRTPLPLLTYRGWNAIVSRRAGLSENCYYCHGVRGKGDKADVERFIRHGVGRHL